MMRVELTRNTARVEASGHAADVAAQGSRSLIAVVDADRKQRGRDARKSGLGPDESGGHRPIAATVDSEPATARGSGEGKAVVG